ncbi:MAG: hypothetical protein ABSE68_02230 [Minisyncoccia bacterium]
MSNIITWIKEHKAGIIAAFGLGIIVSLSFGLGYLVGEQANPALIIIQKNSQ